MSYTTFSAPNQETERSVNSEDRQLAETVITTTIPDSNGLYVKDKAPTNFVVPCDKSEGSLESLGDSLTAPVHGAIQEDQPALESYKDALHKQQDPVKRQRDWHEDAEKVKKVLLDRVDHLEQKVDDLTKENEKLKQNNARLEETRNRNTHTITMLRRDNARLSQELNQQYRHTGADRTCVNASDSLSVEPSRWDKHQT